MKIVVNSYFLVLFLLLSSYNSYSWHKTTFVWNFGLISRSNQGVPKSPYDYFQTDQPFNQNDYKKFNEGDIVWVKTKYLQEFCTQILPKINQPVILLISDGDESFPDNCKSFNIETLLNNRFIVHIFAQNNVYKNEKVSSWPIGMDFHTISYKGSGGGWGEIGNPNEQEAILNNILTTLKPTSQRIKGALVDFHLCDTMHGDQKRYIEMGEDRQSIFERLLPTGLIYPTTWLRRSELWKRKGEYAFSISPHGNGLDCHRTWEDLVLGCIVIVKKSALDVLFEGLPVVIIDDWSQITTENMDKWLSMYGDAFSNNVYREKLTNDYWWSKISKIAAQKCKNF